MRSTARKSGAKFAHLSARWFMLNLNRDEFLDMAEAQKKPCIIPLYQKSSFQKSPIYCYEALYSADGHSYILESVEKGEKRHARFSFVGASPNAIISIDGGTLKFKALDDIGKRFHSLMGQTKKDGDQFDLLASIWNGRINYDTDLCFDRHVFIGGLLGYIAYDTVFDTHIDIKSRHQKLRSENILFMLSMSTILFDHLKEDTYIISNALITPDSELQKVYGESAESIEDIGKRIAAKPSYRPETISIGDLEPNTNKDLYEQMAKKAKKYIYDGDIFQVVLSRRYEIEADCDSLQIYKKLREINPSPYMYCMQFGDRAIVGASPETLVSVHGKRIITNPIAGTRKRGMTNEEDERLAQQMKCDEKEVAEHVMLVDLGRNDVSIVSKPGTVKVEDYMSVLKYSHVQHLESTVTGELKDDCDMFDAVRAVFPAGTVSGAPKIRAMEIIDELETEARGIYAGGIGYFSFNQDADFAIIIRTIVKDGTQLHIQAGAGIVADSVPEYEYYETEKKMEAMMKAVAMLEAGR
ncbi:MAG: anthranilate synthase component I [Methanosarcinales archaeon Met12]|nr:MAG: anthranilate synthase component I [Methanosarcinales archaeon Met12]